MQTLKKRILVLAVSIMMIVSLTPAMAFAGADDSYDWDSAVWAGGLDFSWYDESDVQTEYHLSTPAQWEALAWICSERLGDLADYSTTTNGNITAIRGDIPSAQNTFTGVQFYLDNDIDMGGVKDDSGTWSGPNYYPIGTSCASDLCLAGQTDSVGNIWYGLFYGSFDGQGHIVKNLYCDREGNSENYKDSQMCALFGRVGAADNTDTPETNIVIKNVAVTGFIESCRSSGGVVGKTLHVASGYTVKVENCLNFASVKTYNGSKGVGGVVGALWNGGTVNNCANFGSVTGTYSSANAAGVSGAAEGPTSNSYNVGTVTNTAKDTNSASVALNQQAANVTNCYGLEGSCPGYTTSIVNGNTLVSGGWRDEADMKTVDFLDLLNTDNEDAWEFPQASDPIYEIMEEYDVAGYPVPSVFLSDSEETTAFSVILSGGTVDMTASELDEMSGDESTKSYTGKSGTIEVTANYIKLTDVLEAAGADIDTLTFPLTLTASDGFTRTITAEELPDMYLYKLGDGTYRSAMDGSAGKYWVSGVVSVTEHVHDYGENGICSCGLQRPISAYLSNVSESVILQNGSFTADLYIKSDLSVAAAQLELSCENGTIAQIDPNTEIANIKGDNGIVSFYSNTLSAAEGLKAATIKVIPDESGQDIVLKISTSSVAGTDDSLAEQQLALGDDSTVTVDVIGSTELSCQEYVSSSGKYMIKYTGSVPEGKVPVISGSSMVYSANQDAWILISDTDISESLDSVEFSFEEGTADSVDYSGDVNSNGTTNIIDAQIAYDISIGTYADFEKADISMWYRSDVNADCAVSASDARAIQNYVHTGSFGN